MLVPNEMKMIDLIDLLSNETDLDLPHVYDLAKEIFQILEEHEIVESKNILKNRFNIPDELLGRILNLKRGP